MSIYVRPAWLVYSAVGSIYCDRTLMGDSVAEHAQIHYFARVRSAYRYIVVAKYTVLHR